MLQILFNAILVAPFIFFLPGYLITHILIREKLQLHLVERSFISLLTSILIIGWIGLLLSDLAQFSLPNILVIMSLFNGICFFYLLLKKRIHYPSIPRFKTNYKNYVLFSILVIAALLYFFPGENITLNQDDSPIVNHAFNIFKTQSIMHHDLIFNEVNQKELFYQMVNLELYKGLQFPMFGFYIDSEANFITYQYLDFYPILLAIFLSLFDIHFFLYLTPILAVITILSVYLFTNEIFDWKVSILSTFFLTINFIVIWFARYPGVEILTQLLFFSGLFTFLLSLKYRSLFFPFLSSFIFGTLMLVRLDSILISISILLFLLFLQFIRRSYNKSIVVFSSTYLLFTIFSIFHIFYFDKAYFYDQFINVSRKFRVLSNFSLMDSLLLYLLPPLLLLIGAFIVQLLQRRISIENRSQPFYFNFRLLRLPCVFLIALSFVYLYITRFPFSNGVIGPAQTMLILQWFLTPLGLFLSIIGLIMIINNYIFMPHSIEHDKLLSVIFYLILVIPHILFYVFISLANQPVFPWGFRRYIPIVFPSFIIFMSYGIFNFPTFQKRLSSKRLRSVNFSTGGKVVRIALILILTVSMVGITIDSGILAHREFEGLINYTEEFSSYFDEDSIIIFYNPNPVTGISAPLKHFFGKNAILVPHLQINQSFLDQVNFWIESGRHVYIVTDRPYDLAESQIRTRVEYIFNYEINFPKMENVRNPPVISRPYGKITEIRMNLHVYEIR